MRRSTALRVVMGALVLAGWAWASAAASLSSGGVGSQVGYNPWPAEATSRAGFWRPTVLGSPYGAQCGFNPAQIRTVQDQLRQVSEVFREVAVLKTPVGFEAMVHLTAGSARGIGQKTRMPPSSMSIFLFDYVQPCATCPIAPVGESHCFFHLWINNVDLLYRQIPLEKDEEGSIYVVPRRVGEFAGFPMYDAGNGPYVLMTNDITRPLWVPVSQERYIRAKIADTQKWAEKLKPPRDQQARAELAALEAELAGMSPAERASQAYVGGTHPVLPAGLSPANDPGAQALVAPNPAFFDLTRPRTSFQMAILDTYPLNLLSPGHPDGFIYGKLLEAFKEVDWKRLVNLLQ